MTETTMTQLVARYGTLPLNPIGELTNLFRKSCDLKNITKEEQDAIGEYYRMLENRGLPAYHWMSEIFSIISKKEKSKKNIRYAIGMIRAWSKFGFGHIPSQEEKDLVEYFEEITGMEATPEIIAKIKKSLGEYGIVKVTRMIGRIERDMGSYLVDSMVRSLQEEVIRNEV